MQHYKFIAELKLEDRYRKKVRKEDFEILIEFTESLERSFKKIGYRLEERVLRFKFPTDAYTGLALDSVFCSASSILYLDTRLDIFKDKKSEIFSKIIIAGILSSDDSKTLKRLKSILTRNRYEIQEFEKIGRSSQ